MTQIKTFRFRVSNASSMAFSDDEQKPWYREAQAELVTERDIDNKVNKYIHQYLDDKEIVNIIVTPVVVHRHNNGRSDTVDLIYTIVYKEKD